MEIVKERALGFFNFLWAMIGCSLFQVFAFIISILPFLLIFVFVNPIVGDFLVAVLYGAIWLVFWNSLYASKEGIKWFYYRVAFSVIPLLILLYRLNPTTDPFMITKPEEHVVISLVTGIILLPIYSVSIYKLILQKKSNKVRNTFLVCISNLILGVLIYALSWNTMYRADSTNLQSESMAGIKLMQPGDKKALEKQFGRPAKDFDYGEGKRGFSFDGMPSYLSFEVDENNQITAVHVFHNSSISKSKFTTSKSIGPGSTLSDVLKTYGTECHTKFEPDFMGSGDWYIVTYVDREKDISLIFNFGVEDRQSDSIKTYLYDITLKRGVEK